MSMLPIHRSADEPQPFGILPSKRFWADPVRQRAAVPLATTIAVPLTVLWFLIVVWLRLPPWTLLFDLLAVPVSFGVVERTFRAGFRPAREGSSEARPEHSSAWLVGLVIGISGVSVLLIGLAPPAVLVCAALAATGGAVFLLNRAVRHARRSALTEGRRAGDASGALRGP